MKPNPQKSADLLARKKGFQPHETRYQHNLIDYERKAKADRFQRLRNNGSQWYVTFL